MCKNAQSEHAVVVNLHHTVLYCSRETNCTEMGLMFHLKSKCCAHCAEQGVAALEDEGFIKYKPDGQLEITQKGLISLREAQWQMPQLFNGDAVMQAMDALFDD